MALSKDCCKISFNGSSNQVSSPTTLSLIDIIHYTYNDVGSSLLNYESTCYENRGKTEDRQLLRFLKAQEYESFLLEIECNNPGCAQINGISIESESKTLEFSSNLDGYIKTIRGKNLLVDECGSNHGLENNKMFVCSATFDNPCSDLSVKFLSLKDKERISIRSISINMQQHSLSCKVPSIGSSFDLSRLKKEVEGMGSAVPAGALSLLKTMETFEKNKLNSLGSLSALASPHPNKANGSQSSNTAALPPGMAAILQSVLGDSRMKNIDKSISGKAQETSSENDHVFDMLQAVCGKVSEARTTTNSHGYCSSERNEQIGEDKKVNSSGSLNQVQGNQMVISLLDQIMEEGKKDMRAEIQRVKEEVIHKLEDVRQEINGQLSQILNHLQSLQLSNQSPS